MAISNRISTCLWFDQNGEQAANFYVSLFPNSRVGTISRYGKGTPMPEGTAMVVTFELDGVPFMALNGGTHFKLSEAVSINVRCENQAEIDRLWTRLTENGGSELRCGWLKDRFGLSWQIVPAQIERWMSDPDPIRSARVMAAFMPMNKLDIAVLEAAFNG